MIAGYVIIGLGCICLLMVCFFFHARMELMELRKKREKYTAVQKSFTTAVAGIEANLELEKFNSSLLLRILDTIHDGVALMDENGCLKYANAALWRLYQISQHDQHKYMHESWLNLHTSKGQSEISSKVMPILETNNVWLGESDVMTQKGELIRAELYIAKSSAGYIGFIRNVSSRYEAEQQNRKLSVQLHELKKFEAMEQIMRGIVHEFSNNLSAVVGLSELLVDEVPSGTIVSTYANKICASGLQMQFSLEKARALLPNAQKVTDFSGFPATTDSILQAAQK